MWPLFFISCFYPQPVSLLSHGLLSIYLSFTFPQLIAVSSLSFIGLDMILCSSLLRYDLLINIFYRCNLKISIFSSISNLLTVHLPILHLQSSHMKYLMGMNLLDHNLLYLIKISMTAYIFKCIFEIYIALYVSRKCYLFGTHL